MAPALDSRRVDEFVSQMEDGGVYKRHFWRRLANIVDEKHQIGQIKDLKVGDAVDLAHHVEMSYALTEEGVGTEPV